MASTKGRSFNVLCTLPYIYFYSEVYHILSEPQQGINKKKYKLFFYIFSYINRAGIHHINYSSRTLLLSSLLPLGRGPPLECRIEIRTRACLTASRRATIWVTPHPNWATPHPNWATPHPLKRLWIRYRAILVYDDPVPWTAPQLVQAARMSVLLAFVLRGNQIPSRNHRAVGDWTQPLCKGKCEVAWDRPQEFESQCPGSAVSSHSG